jgi:WD repeat-containing protein 35
MRVMEFDDLIPPVDAYSLIALTAYLAKNFDICSKAFTRLEGIEMGDQMDLAGQLNMIDFTNDLDVTKRSATTSVTGVATVAATTATLSPQMQLIAPSAGAYPTVNINEPPRKFTDLAVRVFTKHEPVDTSVSRVKCSECQTFNKEWASVCLRCQHPFITCIASGKAITDQSSWQCKGCHHRALESEVQKYRNCPLCHFPRY